MQFLKWDRNKAEFMSGLYAPGMSSDATEKQ